MTHPLPAGISRQLVDRGFTVSSEPYALNPSGDSDEQASPAERTYITICGDSADITNLQAQLRAKGLRFIPRSENGLMDAQSNWAVSLNAPVQSIAINTAQEGFAEKFAAAIAALPAADLSTLLDPQQTIPKLVALFNSSGGAMKPADAASLITLFTRDQLPEAKTRTFPEQSRFYQLPSMANPELCAEKLRGVGISAFAVLTSPEGYFQSGNVYVHDTPELAQQLNQAVEAIPTGRRQG